MNTLRKAINTITALTAFYLCFCVMPAQAALPNGLQDVYTIFTTGIPPSSTGPDTPSCKDGLAYASWSSPDFILNYDGGTVGGLASPGIVLAPDSYPPTGAFIEYASAPGTDTNLHWMKVTANNSTLGSFQLTQLVIQGAGDGDPGTYNIIGTKVGGGTVQTGNTVFNLNINNPPLTIDLSTTPLAGQQITSFEIDFTMSDPSAPRPADVTFQTFTVSNAKAPSTVTGISPTSGLVAGGTSVIITGTNFTGATVVKFGSTNAASFSVDSPTQITAISPAGSGMVDITVDGSATSTSDQFTYVSAPTVTTQAASSILATSATGNGAITATNGANATVRGVIYWGYNGTDQVIGDGGVINITENGNFGTGAFTASLPSLSVNTQYNARAYATSTNGTGYGARVALWTLANVPSAPTVNTPSATTLNVAVNVNGNPTSTEFCIQETSTSNYVQADGSLAAGQVWQAAAAWGIKTVMGLTAGTTYTFQVKARNGNSTETAYGATASGIPFAVPTVTTQAASVITATSATGNGNITATNGANSTARGVIYWGYNNADQVIGDSGVTNITENGDFGTGAFTASLTSLSVNTQYNARAYATSSNGTGYGTRVAFWTLANVSSAPTVNNPTATTLDVTVNVNSNPASTEFCVQETSTGNYVQASGALGGACAWQNAATWGTKTVTGLTAGTTYTFQVKARNGENTETAYGATASGVPVIVTVTGISPSSGPVAGGTSVTISGTNFTGVTGVTIGGLAATGISEVNATTITATTPAGTAGIRDVVVTTPAGSGTGAGIFTYIATPTATAATAITTSSFTANWGSAGGATGYYLDVATDAGFTNFVSGYNNLDAGNVTSKTITGLTSATLYYYRVRAYNSGGTSADSNIISLTTGQSRIVTISGDSGAGSLRQSIADANPGDTITFSVTGTITLASPLVISKDLIINGPGAANLTISGGGAIQPFQVSAATTFTLQNLTIANGTAADGGALSDNSAATTTITGCVFSSNNATGNGGAIHASGTITISDTLFSGNSAVHGGAILNNTATLALTNVTITGNTATSNGGGMYTIAGTATIANTTIASNTATTQGGGIEVAGGTVNLKNSIVAKNAATSGPDIYGTIVSQDYNLIQTTIDAIITGTTTNNITGSDPKLGTLADNGGPTQTMALLSGSPAIDAGTCSGGPGSDQRGMTRPQNSVCDMGAYERGVPATLTATGGTAQSTAINTAFATPLSARVVDSLGVLLDGVSVTFAGPGSGAGIVSGSAITDITGIASFSATANAAAGSYTVTATVNSLTANYSLTNKAAQTIGAISFTPGSLAVGGTTTVSASASSGLAVTFSSQSTDICTVNGTTITGVAVGTCTIAAYQAGDATYAATQATQNITVAKGSQTITFGAAPAVYIGTFGTVSASASSGLAVSFSSQTTSICTISGSTVTGVAAGTCIIAANQAGNANYNAASQVTQNITVTPELTLTVSTLADGAVTTTSTLNVSGTVTNPANLSTLTINGTSIAITSIGSFSYPVQLVAGANTISVIAVNNVGTTRSDSRTITLDSSALSLTVSSPADNATTNQSFVTVSGTATDSGSSAIITVTYSVNGATAQTAAISGTNYSFTANLASGMNTIIISATSSSGKTAQAKRTISQTPFSLSVTDPATDIRTVLGTYLLKGRVSGNSTSVTMNITMDGTTYTPAVDGSSGAFEQQLPLSSAKIYQIGVTGTDQNSNSVTVQRNIIHSAAGTSSYTIADALLALQTTVGTVAPTTSQIQWLDVAPLVNGVSVGDGKIDIEDAVVILRMAVGLI